jgi:hypothetical protein
VDREDRKRHEEEESELLSIYLMGDIREDAQFIGLSLKDIGWIMGTTLVLGFVPFLLPFSVWFKFIWLLAVAICSFMGRLLRIPYRRKRYYMDKRHQPKGGTGEQVADLLGMEEDGWFYVSTSKQRKPIIQILYSVQVPPWETAILNQKRQRIAAFGQFIRAAAKEGFTVDVFTEQIPDFRHDIWQQKELAPSDSEGIHNLKMMRLSMWRGLAERNEAQRSVYTMRLTIDHHRIEARQRDDEPAEASKDELKRYRFVAELREMQSRVMAVLSKSGHAYQLLSGYITPELLGRWWDRNAWERWASADESWEEPVDAEATEEEALDAGESTSLEMSELEGEAESASTSAMWKQALAAGISRIGKSLRTWVSGLSKLVERLRKPPSVKGEPSGAETAESAETATEPTKEAFTLTPGIRVLTSPVPSGKTFLAINVASAWSSHETPIHLVDLSPDRGCKTALNPLPITSREEGWEAFMSRHAPGLTLWIPDPTGDMSQVANHLQRLAERCPVIVDMPWSYPNREELLALGCPVAVVDSDYHHWLQWERLVPSWQGEVWVNGAEDEMEKAIRSLVKEQWEPTTVHVFPNISGARKWLYQGLPPATDGQIRSQIRQMWQVGEGGESA